MRLTEFYSGGVGNLCICATTKSLNNSIEKYDFAEDRVYVYVVSGEGVMQHPQMNSNISFIAGNLFNVRDFQSSDYTLAVPQTDAAFWIGFNLKPSGKDYTVKKLSVGEHLHGTGNDKKTSVVVVSGLAQIEGKDVGEKSFAYLKRGQENFIALEEGSLAFLLEEL